VKAKPGPSFVSIGHLSGVGVRCGTVVPVSMVVGAAVPAAVYRSLLGAVPVLSWCGEMSLGGKQSSSRCAVYVFTYAQALVSV